MLNENYYTNVTITNQTDPHFARHTNLVTSIRNPDCTTILSYNHSERCEFVNSARLQNNTKFDPTVNCDNLVALFNYLDFLYCKLNVRTSKEEIGGAFLLFLVLIYYFMVLGITADTFFCPALTVLAKLLRLNDVLAGVTLLAFGNGSPDLFTSLSTKDSESPTLFYQLLGASIFVTAFISSIIIIINPFKIDSAEFTRDCSFLIFAVAYLDLILLDGYVTLAESIGIFVIYIIYLTVIIVDLILVNMEKKEFSRLKHNLKVQLNANTSANLTPPNSLIEIELEHRKKTLKEKIKFWKLTIFKQFVSSINPIHLEDWRSSSKFSRFFIILRSPLLLLLRMLLPVVSFEQEMNGWSKLLNCLQVTILPTVFTLQIVGLLEIYDFPTYLYIMFSCLPISIILLFITKTNKEPKFHKLMYALLTIGGSIWVIKIFADEAVSILTSIGIVMKMTQSFLAVTFLAMGNSIGDLITNITMARQGHQKMGLSACFGGPLFNLIVGMGFVCISRSIEAQDRKLALSEGSIGDNCVVFQLIFLCFSLVGLSFVNFHATRRIGSFGILVYILFFCYVCLAQFETIHEYGTDHREDDIAQNI